MNRSALRTFVGLIGVLGILTAPASAQHAGHGHAGHDHDAGKDVPVPKCPVTGEPVNLAVSTSTKDGPVFFCCKECESTYLANPEKYAGEVAIQRRALAERPKIQVSCPVTGEPVNTDVFLESAGKKIYFCCKGCVRKYQRDPAKYASALANSYTYQTKCPVMGEEVDPGVFTETASGAKIYFCCKGCDRKFFANPQKYIASLEAQGFDYKVKDMVHKKSGGDKDDHAGHDHGGGHGGHDHDH